MAGIYLHIPFCKSKCPYCNFFSVASIKAVEEFLPALHIEIGLQQHYLGNQKVETLYFGGGTPSLIKPSAISRIIEQIRNVFSVEETAEITLEANPDDISVANLKEWSNAGINRLSIGVQSFNDADLKYLGRIHSGAQAEKSVQLALDQGFSNLSVDFIYGMPSLSDLAFASNLEKAVSLHIPHISAYALTTEPKTALEAMIRKQQIMGPDEETAVSQFGYLMQYLDSCGYQHYEISNFCLPGKYSRHNSSYWKGDHYLGLGPSAHSFNGVSRQWNVSGINRYTEMIHSGKPHFETEILSQAQKYNEYIMVSIRTIWGISLGHLIKEFGGETAAYFKSRVMPYVGTAHIFAQNDVFTLSDKGKLFADKISSDLFLDID